MHKPHVAPPAGSDPAGDTPVRLFNDNNVVDVEAWLTRGPGIAYIQLNDRLYVAIQSINRYRPHPRARRTGQGAQLSSAAR